ncbi:MAG: FGGY-family carbohydrate kinase, partial [Acidimicrobiales bacterium]
DNPVFVGALADACGRPIEIAPVVEATTLGAAYLAGMATGMWEGEDQVAAAWSPRAVIEPQATPSEREALRSRWLEARDRARATIPELSGLDF